LTEAEKAANSLANIKMNSMAPTPERPQLRKQALAQLQTTIGIAAHLGVPRDNAQGRPEF
jgi:hypothetical protein